MPLSTIDLTGLSNPFGAPTGGNVMASWNTAGRPATPSTGQYGYNTTYGGVEVYNGSAWDTITGGPAFNGTTNTSTSISTSTWTKITLNTTLFDTNSNFSTSNYRFTPTVAGYYQINGFVEFNSATTSLNAFVAIYKNGSVYQYGSHAGFNATNGIGLTVSTVVQCNGSTDYIELYATQNTGSTQTVSSSSYMSGSFIRSA